VKSSSAVSRSSEELSISFPTACLGMQRQVWVLFMQRLKSKPQPVLLTHSPPVALPSAIIATSKPPTSLLSLRSTTSPSLLRKLETWLCTSSLPSCRVPTSLLLLMKFQKRLSAGYNRFQRSMTLLIKWLKTQRLMNSSCSVEISTCTANPCQLKPSNWYLPTTLGRSKSSKIQK
jgi:hypothetical protein